MKNYIITLSVFLITGFRLIAANSPGSLPEFMTPAQVSHWATDKGLSAAKSEEHAPSFYTGKPYVAEMGGYVYAYRTYYSEAAHWTSTDPSGFPDGSNNQAYAPVPTHAIDYEGLVSINFTVSDADTFGVTSASIATMTNATVTAAKSGDCWVANIKDAFKFTGTGTEMLPKVGDNLTSGGNTAKVDQTFHDSTKTHEDWHVKQDQDAAKVTYTALETWSASYSSNMFKTQQQALDAGMADLNAALTLAKNAFNDFYTRSGNHEGANPATGYYYSNTDITWRSQNPDWGAPFDKTINDYKINFTKTAGNCE